MRVSTSTFQKPKRVMCLFLSLLFCIGLIGPDRVLAKSPNVAQTPPMGWNSYDCFGFSVTEDEVKANADYVAKHLKHLGYEYIVVDFLWYGEDYEVETWMEPNQPIHIDEYGRMIPSVKLHPSSAGGKGFKPLADYVHGLGLKFGIHLMRGIPWNAVEKNTPIKGTDYFAGDIASEEKLCFWYQSMKTVNMDKPGAQEYYDSLIDLYASWDVDFLKIDDMARGTEEEWHPKEIAGYRKAIDKTGRDIVYSLSPGPAHISNADFLCEQAHMIRISGDVWDDWDKYVQPQFKRCADWTSYIGAGHWPDADMLPLGKISIRSEAAYAHDLEPRFPGMTRDEQQSMMTLWSIFRSPLMLGGHLPENDDWTFFLISNEAVTKMNQHSLNNREVYRSSESCVWAADSEESGKCYVALFNLDDSQALDVYVTWEQLGIKGKKKVTDLWTGEDLGEADGSFGKKLNPHACLLVSISGN